MSAPGPGRRLLFGAVTAAVALASVEIMLQAFYYATAGDFLFRRVLPPILEPDPVRCYRHQPDLDYVHRTNEYAMQVYTNAQGLRTDARRRPIEPAKPDDVYRVLFLGPSFAFGWGAAYEESYAARIAAGLRVPGRRVELMNLGTIGQGPGPQLCWLREVGPRYAPDLVIATSYGEGIGPMLGDCPEPLECPVVKDGRLYTVRPTFGRRVIGTLKNFATVFDAYYAVNAFQQGGPEEARDGVGVGRELYSEAERSVDAADVERLADAFARTVDFARGALGEGARVVFVHLPLSFLVHPEDLPRWSHILDTTPAEARANTRAGVEAVRARGVPIVDATPALIEAGRGERMYYWLDIHLTPAGNRVVAEAAMPVVQALVDGDQPGSSRARSPSASITSTSSSVAFSSLLPGSAPASR